ncbi:AGAP009256-PE-like protein [Anopheles sinensis]|uniref:Gustatory receptor n=1 Tax=Anopheles sinensis TaxID=74873 RepID=A0A084WH19_ANOSI|nr:AGAP009256-PE-like protein [Anopheles sinensis]
MEKWVHKCFVFNLLYEITCASSAVVVGLVSDFLAPKLMLVYVPCLVLTTLSKGIVLLIVYGAGQYLWNVSKVLNVVLLTHGQPSFVGWSGLMELYGQLWKCCECFNALFGLPIVCYLLLVCINTTVVLYTLLSDFMLGKGKFTPANVGLTLEEVVWALFEMFCIKLIIGTCIRIKYEAVLLGVFPFRYQLLPAGLENKTLLLIYCYLVSICAQVTRLLMNFLWSWSFAPEYFILRATAIFNYSLESVVVALPVFYVLSRQHRVIAFFNHLKQLYYNPLLVGYVRIEWLIVKCFKFNLLYDIVYIISTVIYGVLSGDFPPELMLVYLSCLFLTTFSKGIVLLIMYAAVQYLLAITKAFNNVLRKLSGYKTSSVTHLRRSELMEFYDQLWRCSECFNSLFGIPIVCYLLLVCLHTTAVFYMLSSTFLLGKERLTPTEIVVSVEEIVWAIFDLLYVMHIVGKCSLVKQEVR